MIISETIFPANFLTGA